MPGVFGAEQLRFTGMAWGGGGGGVCTAFLHAALAVASGQANYVAVVRGVVQAGIDGRRYGRRPGNEDMPYPLVTSPAHMFALIARRHMHVYGMTIDHFGEVAINARLNAARNPDARFRAPITMADHHNSRVIADPLRLLDCCMESDSGSCVIVTTAERARDLRQPPVFITGAATGAPYRWGNGLLGGYNMSPEDFASGGQRSVAADVFRHAGVGPADIDVACIYDHFSPMVLLALEDFGFVAKGESGPFVANGGIRRDGEIPVNPHGGNLAEVYNHGMNLVYEAMRQMRGTSANQIKDAEVALVVGGSAPVASSALVVRK
jgi:acetyl-CoA acetyltransferase